MKTPASAAANNLHEGDKMENFENDGPPLAKRGRGRPRKATSVKPTLEKPKWGRPRKLEAAPIPENGPKRRRGRPSKKVNTEFQSSKPQPLSKGLMRDRLEFIAKRLRNEAKRQSTWSRPDYYPLQVELAHQVALAWLEGRHRNLLLYLPPQGGKTGATLVSWLMFKSMLGDLNGSLVCGADYRALRAQHKAELEKHGLKVLSQGERLKIPKVLTPYIVFVDETHFGDGAGMTIDQFLERNYLKIHPNVIFVGVSATPFSCVSRLHTIRVDLKKLEDIGYNSPRTMREAGRLFESTPLFIKVNGIEVVDERSNCWQEIVLNVNKKRPWGYGLIRLKSSKQAKILEDKVKETFQGGFFIDHWNQATKSFEPAQAFARKGAGTFTLVLIVHMARMGVVIDTTYMRFMWEFSPKSPIETLVQSLVGRACGYGKRAHKTKIFTHLDHIDAYIHFAEWRLDQFFAEVERKKLKISRRAHVGTDVFDRGIKELPRLELSDKLTEKEVKHLIREYCARLGLKSPVQRTLSANVVRDSEAREWAIDGTIPDLSVRSEVGSTSFYIFDRPRVSTRTKTWKGIVVRIFTRVSAPVLRTRLMPKDSSYFFSDAFTPV